MPSTFRAMLAVALFGFVAACKTSHTAAPQVAMFPSASLQSTSELASRFRAYRVALRDMSGTPDPQLRSWAGPVHAVMSELGERLGSGHTVGEIVSLLGEPDAVLLAAAHHSGIVVPLGCEHLLYRWRGGHDYLYFHACQGHIKEARWWHAGE